MSTFDSEDWMKYTGVADAARFLGVSESSVRKYIKEGYLKAEKVGGQWQLEINDVMDLAQMHDDPENNDGDFNVDVTALMLYDYPEQLKVLGKAYTVLDFKKSKSHFDLYGEQRMCDALGSMTTALFLPLKKAFPHLKEASKGLQETLARIEAAPANNKRELLCSTFIKGYLWPAVNSLIVELSKDFPNELRVEKKRPTLSLAPKTVTTAPRPSHLRLVSTSPESSH